MEFGRNNKKFENYYADCSVVVIALSFHTIKKKKTFITIVALACIQFSTVRQWNKKRFFDRLTEGKTNFY